MNKKYKCGLDLDGVVYKFVEEFDKFAINRGMEIDPNDYNRGLDKTTLNRLLTDFGRTKPFKWIPLYDNIQKQLNKLSKFMDFYIVTHRDWYKEGKVNTIHRLALDKIPFKKIYFTKDKYEISNKEGLDYFIEDNLQNSLDLLEFSKTLPILINRDYNQGNNFNLIRVDSLEDLL